MSQSLRDAYNAVPYPATPYPQTHPGRMAAIGSLFGMGPAPIDNCSVLEIGCADGSNLLPLAALFPNSRFTGIDLSERQIASGQVLAKELALSNLTLLAEDFTDITFINGPFDYIIAHGVYSWVPPAVGGRLLELFADHLAPQGIGYLSYNTLPGWQARATLRELIVQRYRDRSIDADDLPEIRRFLEEFRSTAALMPGSYPPLMAQAIDAMLGHAGDYWFHDLLEIEQHPVSFQEIANRLKAKDLQPLGDAELHAMFGRGLPQGVLEKLQSLATDRSELEQLMDVMIYRSFRQTLVCRTDIRLASVLEVDRLRELAIISRLTEIPTAETSETHGTFRTHRGLTITQRSQAVVTALRHLISCFPASRTGSELWNLTATKESQKGFYGALVQLLTYDALDVQAASVPIAQKATGKVRGFSLARVQARSSDVVTTLHHEQVHLSEEERTILRYLDGSEDVMSLYDRCAGAIAAESIPRILHQLANAALLQS